MGCDQAEVKSCLYTVLIILGEAGECDWIGLNPVCKKLHIAKKVIVVQAAAGDHINHNLATTRHYEEWREKMPLEVVTINTMILEK